MDLSADESFNTSISFGMWLSHFIEKNNTNTNISDRKWFPITAQCRRRGATEKKKQKLLDYINTKLQTWNVSWIIKMNNSNADVIYHNMCAVNAYSAL